MRDPRELVSSEALRRYDDNGDPVYSPIERVLLALRWFDWASSARIMEALELEAADLKERERYVTALSRLVTRGRVERRGASLSWFEYRLAAKQPVIRERSEPAWRLGREERQQLGLCLRCDSLPVPGRRQCQHHLDLQSGTNRRRRAS
jgi:hypothetical protein